MSVTVACCHHTEAVAPTWALVSPSPQLATGSVTIDTAATPFRFTLKGVTLNVNDQSASVTLGTRTELEMKE